jgi:ParB family chromosome partitioning protein
MGKRQSLGKGLKALIPDLEPMADEPVHTLPTAKIRPNPYQPRKRFDPIKMGELVSSIREHGIIQPIVVRSLGEAYQIVAGERRWRAAKEVGLADLPAVVREFTDLQVMEIALIENLQREDLNPIEEAQAYKRLIDGFNLTQEQLAQRMGKSRPAIANALRLLNLSPEVLEHVSRGTITAGHAKVLLAIEDEGQQIEMAQRIIGEGLSVREVEALIHGAAEKKKTSVSRGTSRIKKQPAEIRELENQLSMALGTRVNLKHGGKKGKIEIEYYNDLDLERIASIIIKEKRKQLYSLE